MTYEHLYKAALLPENHWECSLSKIPEFDYKPLVLDWVENVKDNVYQGKGLLLHGEHGAGKSGIAAICIKAALSKMIMGLWIPAEFLPDYKIRENDFYFSEEVTMLERIQSVKLLVIDDMIIREKRQQKSDWIETSLEMIVRRRTDSKLCTIITTNHDLRHIKENSKSLAAILSEATKPICVQGFNFRLNK